VKTHLTHDIIELRKLDDSASSDTRI